tara:strand:- start:1139 stop:1297 length:159 start_codon:yes stop_codon:yes gene_type:complete
LNKWLDPKIQLSDMVLATLLVQHMLELQTIKLFRNYSIMQFLMSMMTSKELL